MTYVAHLGVRRRWLSTAPGPAVAAAALGVVLLLVANALPFTYDRNGKASAYSLLRLASRSAEYAGIGVLSAALRLIL